MRKIGVVSHIEITLESGQPTVRDRALIRNLKDKIFVDSIRADDVKVCFYKSEEDAGFREHYLRDERSFLIFVRAREFSNSPDKFGVKIGDVIVELQKGKDDVFKISKILKGGFVKSGNEVFLLSFEKSS